MDERELHHMTNALFVDGKAKLGTTLLTDQRLLFVQTKALNVTGGAIGAFVTEQMNKKGQADGPLLDLPLTDITGATRQKKLLNKNLMTLSTTGGDVRLNDGWGKLGPALRDAIAATGATVGDAGEDAWTVSR